MSHHISPVDCAPVSPLVSLSSQLSSINAQLQDIPSFGHSQSKSVSGVPSAVTPLLSAPLRSAPSPLSSHSLRPAAARLDGSAHSHFLSHFRDGVKLDAPHFAATAAAHPTSHELVAEQLRRMELSKHAAHADELERIYRQHAPTALRAHPHHQQAQQSHQWAAEFHPSHSPLHSVHQRIVQQQQTPQWAAEFEALKQQYHQPPQQQQHHAAHHQLPATMLPMMQHSRPMLPLPSYSASYAMQRQNMSMLPAALFPSQPVAGPVAVSQLPQPTQQQPDTASASNVHAVSESDMLNSFPQSSVADSSSAQLPQQTSGDGLGGGLNADMIDALLSSDDPKWRQSKFLQFISKIKSGQIEFRDNQAIDSGPSRADSATTAQQQSASGAQWADEYTSGEQQMQSSFPTAWSEDFEQREGLRGLSTADELSRMAAGWSGELSADAEDEKVWEDEYRRVVQGEAGLGESEANDVEDEKEWAQHFQQHAEFDSFSHINWREALEKARTANSGATVELDSAADPQYDFTSPLQSAHSDANAAYEEGVRLLDRGELRAAIAAFETAVRLDPEHSEAWCQLGAAQAENEEESNAIAALLKSVAIDPYNLKALMMLGVSYTNDLEESRALQYLKTW